MAIRSPLSPWLYFRRNPSRTLPLAFVIVVAVALVASIVTIIASIDLTVLTMYGYQRHFAVVTPRNTLSVDEEVERTVRADPLAGRTFSARPAMTMVRTVFGKMPTVVFALPAEGRQAVMEACGLTLSSGRMLMDGRPEVVLHEDIARNKGLKLGDVVLDPNSEDSFAAEPMRLVGTMTGPVWLALASESFIEATMPVAPRGLVVLSHPRAAQTDLDASLERNVDKSRARVWTYRHLVRDTRDALSSLHLIMNIVIGIIVFAIAFLTGMLSNIHFTQRLPEFATLIAIGYQRASLMFRALGETGILCAIGWLLGSALTVSLLVALKSLIMHPRGLLLDPFDFTAYRYTLPIPLAIAGFAMLAMFRRLRGLDPVAIIERRQ